MARPLRIEFPGAIYHVTSRGDGRDDIYLSEDDRQMFLRVLSQAVFWLDLPCMVSDDKSLPPDD
jgi:hypothetical protein